MDFQEIRRAADRTVGDAEDWLRSDWTDQPTAHQVAMLNTAAVHLSQARAALAAASMPGLPDALESATLADALHGWTESELRGAFGK